MFVFVGTQRDLLVGDVAAPGVQESAFAALALEHVVLFPEARKVGARSA